MARGTRDWVGAALAALVASALCGCVVEAPVGPATFVVTVAPWPAAAGSPADVLGRAFPDESGRVQSVTFTEGARDVWSSGAELLAQAVPGRFDSDARFVPGTLETLAERLSREEFEGGAFLSGETFDEKHGLLQGCLHHDEHWMRAAAGVDAGPLGAANAGAQFVELRLMRALEDTPFAWVHLDLGEAALAQDLEPASAPDAALARALERIAAAVQADPAAVVALVRLDAPAGEIGAAVRARGAALPPPTARADFGTWLRNVMAASEAAQQDVR
jgi:hypothetical protein